jgi:endonuclease YncB( thermonuclease family)
MFSCFGRCKSSSPSESNSDVGISADTITQNNKINNNKIMDFKKTSRFSAKSGYYYVQSVYDGDTMTILIPILFKSFSFYENSKGIQESNVNLNSCTDDNDILYYKVRVRILGVDTYEMKPRKNIPDRDEHIRKAKDAKIFLENLILNKTIFMEFSDSKFDPYGRPLATVFFEDVDIATLLIKGGHGVSYDGGTKTL